MEYRVCRNNPAPYNDLNGKISLLGLGTMRLPLRDTADQTSIDEEKAQEIFDYAYAHGVNYFDTAYPYHGGMSEKFCGKALAKYPRASYHLASKLPGWLVICDEAGHRIISEQLANCRTDYFDFYLVHSVHESSWSNYVKYHAYDQLNELRKAGKIKRLGFSFHGSAEQLSEILAAGDWDFVQLQLNYFDWDYQQSRKKYELCAAAGLQVIVMEPVRGGMLSTLCPEAAALLHQAAPEKRLASWAIRWDAPVAVTVSRGFLGSLYSACHHRARYPRPCAGCALGPKACPLHGLQVLHALPRRGQHSGHAARLERIPPVW